jgi:HPt (histidine-containing phosphotransfer) domain-containing protein/PAS domain-containing protein
MRLDLPAGQPVTVLMRLASGGPLRFPVQVWSPKAFISAKSKADIIISLYYGIMLAMIIYNCFLSISLENKEHLYYVFYTAAFLCYQASFNGLAQRFLWPDFPLLSDYAIQFFQAVSGFWMIVFTKHFLNIKRRNHVMYWSLQALIVWSIVTVISTFTASYRLSLMLSLSFASMAALVLLLVAVRRLVSGYRPARFYVTAFSCFFVGVIATALAGLGVMTDQFFTIYGAQIGSALEVVLLSIALGDKIRIDQRQKNSRIEKLNDDLNIHINHIEDLVDLKTREVRSILEFVEIGIFMIDRDIKIQKDYSRYLAELTDFNRLDGKDCLELIFESTHITGEEQSKLKSAIQSMIGENKLNFMMNRHLLVHEVIKLGVDGQQAIWELDWNPVEDEADTIVYMLVSIRDVTERRKLAQQIHYQEENIALIAELCRINHVRFQRCLDQTENLAKRCLERLKTTSADTFHELVTGLDAALHTIKGNARTVGMRILADKVHDIEDQVAEAKGQGKHNLFEVYGSGFDSLVEIANKYTQAKGVILQQSSDDDKVKAELPKTQLKRHIAHLQSLDPGDSKAVLVLRQQLLTDFNRLCYMSIEQAFGDLENSMGVIAKELHKEKPCIHFHKESKLRLASEAQDTLYDILGHLVRNSLDHGIEGPDVRRQLGKPSRGQIFVEFAIKGEFMTVIYYDDGAGIDLTRIRNRAVGMQLIQQEESLSDQQLAELIFHPGLSTALTVTQISGRGLGMSAVREILEGIDGKINIELTQSERQTKCAFRYEIQYPLARGDELDVLALSA